MGGEEIIITTKYVATWGYFILGIICLSTAVILISIRVIEVTIIFFPAFIIAAIYLLIRSIMKQHKIKSIFQEYDK